MIQVPTTPGMKAGTSTKNLEAVEGPTRDELNLFHEKIAIAHETKEGDQLPEIEVPRKIINYYNRHSIKGFDKAGYFIYQGVKVFEIGKREELRDRDSMSIEVLVHGQK